MTEEGGHGGDIWKASKETGLAPSEIIDFSASISPLGPPERAVERVKESLDLIGAYPEPRSGELTRELALYHAIKPKTVVCGNGSTEFLYLLANVIRPERALIVEPAFSEYRCSLALSGAEVEGFAAVRDKDYAVDIDALIGAIGGGVDILYMANPANPTGALTSREELLRVAAECDRHGIYFVLDEAFCDFTEEESLKADVEEFAGLIILRSMTKFFSLAGLRLGYLLASSGNAELVRRYQPPWSVNTPAMAAGIESLRDSAYIESVRSWFAHEARPFYDSLKALEGIKVYPSAANFFTFELTDRPAGAGALVAALLEDGIMVRHLEGFASLAPGSIRVALRERADNRLLVERLKSALSSL